MFTNRPSASRPCFPLRSSPCANRDTRAGCGRRRGGRRWVGRWRLDTLLLVGVPVPARGTLRGWRIGRRRVLGDAAPLVRTPVVRTWASRSLRRRRRGGRTALRKTAVCIGPPGKNISSLSELYESRGTHQNSVDLQLFEGGGFVGGVWTHFFWFASQFQPEEH